MSETKSTPQRDSVTAEGNSELLASSSLVGGGTSSEEVVASSAQLYAALLDPNSEGARNKFETSRLSSGSLWQSRIAGTFVNHIELVQREHEYRANEDETSSSHGAGGEGGTSRLTGSPVGELIRIHDLDHIGFVQPLIQDIIALKTMCMDTIGRHVSPSDFKVLLSVQQLAYNYYAYETEDSLNRLADRLSLLSTKQLSLVALMAMLMCLMVNFAENAHRIRRRRMFERLMPRIGLNKIRDCYGQGQFTDSIWSTFEKLQQAGYTNSQIYRAITELKIEFVLTAHPTEAMRAAVLQSLETVAESIVDLDRPDLTPTEVSSLQSRIRRAIELCWEIDPLRRKKPTVYGEAQGIANVIEESVFNVVPQFLRFLDQRLAEIGQPPLPVDCAPLVFASWAGGDRDGNPFVTADVTKAVVLQNYVRGCSLFLARLERLFGDCCLHTASESFKAYVSEKCGGATGENFMDQYKLPLTTSKTRFRTQINFPQTDEYYRRFLMYIRYRLAATLEYYERWSVLVNMSADGVNRYRSLGRPGEVAAYAANEVIYKNSDEFYQELKMIYDSLHACGDSDISDGTLKDILRQVRAFGLSLLKLDLRQEAKVHTDCMNKICKLLEIGTYMDLDESSRLYLLETILSSKRPLIPKWAVEKLDGLDRDVLSTIQIAAEFGKDCFSSYIISMCSAASDILLVEVLQREYLGDEGLGVVPLLETIDALRGSQQMLQDLFSSKWYCAHLRQKHNNIQEIMIGYSDSGKDGSRFTSAWELYKTQLQLTELADSYGIQLKFFHGRGGSVSRGGGPQHLAILSQPPGTIRGQFRTTIQGEIIHQHFALPQMTSRSFEHFVTAILEHDFFQGAVADVKKNEYFGIMDEMSTASMNRYRGIVYGHPRFVEYFRQATPEQELGKLNIGSRPSKRKEGGVETLRAIPWVFAWTQTRNLLPVWLGLGTALKEQAEKPKGMETLREIYMNWPYFKAFVDLISMVMAKANSQIAAYYDRVLVHDEELLKLGEEIRREFQDTRTLIRKVTRERRFLDNDLLTQRALDVRMPWVAPANIVQVEVLARLRKVKSTAEGPISNPVITKQLDEKSLLTLTNAEAQSMTIKELMSKMQDEKTPQSTPADTAAAPVLLESLITPEADSQRIAAAEVERKNLEDVLHIAIKAIASGMQNTG